MVQPRDLIGTQIIEVESDVLAYGAQCSVAEDGDTPILKGTTRANLTVGGWVLEKNGDGVDLTYVVKGARQLLFGRLVSHVDHPRPSLQSTQAGVFHLLSFPRSFKISPIVSSTSLNGLRKKDSSRMSYKPKLSPSFATRYTYTRKRPSTFFL